MFAGQADAAMVAKDANSLRTSLSSYDANVYLGGLQKHLPTSVFSPASPCSSSSMSSKKDSTAFVLPVYTHGGDARRFIDAVTRACF